MNKLFTIPALLVAIVACTASCGGGSTPTSPTPPPVVAAPSTPQPPAPPSAGALTGIVTVTGTSTRVSGVPVRVLDGPNTGRATTTNASGAYRFDDLTPGNANFAAGGINGWEEARAGIYVDGLNVLNFSIRTIAPWSQSGNGNTVFDMPSHVARVRIIGTFNGFCQNFAVRLAGRLLVNEILGSCSNAIGPRYDGIHLTTGGGVLEVVISTGVSWSITEAR